MKLTPEKMASWFFTAFPAQFPAGEEEKWLNQFSQLKGRERRNAVAGMKQGVNDVLTMARHLPTEARTEIDSALAVKDLPSLRKMEAGLKKKHRTILKRGRIKNEEEFYLVAEILSDLEFDVTDFERTQLEKIALDFDQRGKWN
ncbi:hypothetical protein [Synoicihabitans lomoniglobus]|nr:hypothetical protein [Opitutaceae bacterium LMO-M01]